MGRWQTGSPQLPFPPAAGIPGAEGDIPQPLGFSFQPPASPSQPGLVGLFLLSSGSLQSPALLLPPLLLQLWDALGCSPQPWDVGLLRESSHPDDFSSPQD